MYSQEELKAAGLLEFRRFLYEVWHHLRLPNPTPVQLDIARQLQYGPDRDIISAFRGVGKSWITVAYVLWTLLCDPQKKVEVVSASEGEAINFSTFSRQLIYDMPLLQHLKSLPGQRSSNLAFDVGPALPDKSPSVKSVGLTGQLTGSRADLIVPDDIEVPKNSYTHVQRERIAELVKEFDAVLKPGGKVKFLGTPQVEASLYNRMLERGYSMSVWPVEIPAKVDDYHGRLAPLITKMLADGATPGTLVEPSRFTRDEITARLGSYGRSGFSLQFMLNTTFSDSDRRPLRCSDLIVADLDDEQSYVKMTWGRERDLVIQDLACGGLEGDTYYRPAWKSEQMAPYQMTIMCVDPSGGGKDETAYCIARLLFSKIFIVKVGGYTAGFSEDTLKGLAGLAARYKVQRIYNEENFGGGMFSALLQPYVQKVCGPGACTIEDVWHTGQKELRILDTLEPLIQAHRVVFDRRVIEEDREVQENNQQYSLIYQMTRMERTKGALAHEDRLEALSMACGAFVDRMKTDQDKQLEDHKEALVKKELEKFLSNAITVGARQRTPVSSGPHRLLRLNRNQRRR